MDSHDSNHSQKKPYNLRPVPYVLSFTLRMASNIYFKSSYTDGLLLPTALLLRSVFSEQQNTYSETLLVGLNHHLLGTFLYNSMVGCSLHPNLSAAVAGSAARLVHDVCVNKKYYYQNDRIKIPLYNLSIMFVPELINQLVVYKGIDALLGSNIMLKFAIRTLSSTCVMALLTFSIGRKISTYREGLTSCLGFQLQIDLAPVDKPIPGQDYAYEYLNRTYNFCSYLAQKTHEYMHQEASI